jgi:DNA-binding beta-propeller fold protein YncE
MGVYLFLIFLLIHPQSVLYVKDTLYVSDAGGIGIPGDGKIFRIIDEERETVVEGLDDPRGISYFNGTLYVVDENRVWAILEGKAKVLAGPENFPNPPGLLFDIAVDSLGYLYVTDLYGNTVYIIDRDGNVDELFSIKNPRGIYVTGDGVYVVKSSKPGKVYRFSGGKLEFLFASKNIEEGTGLLVRENIVIVSGAKSGRVILFDLNNRIEKVILREIPSPADMDFNDEKGTLIIPLSDSGELYFLKMDTLIIR